MAHRSQSFVPLFRNGSQDSPAVSLRFLALSLLISTRLSPLGTFVGIGANIGVLDYWGDGALFSMKSLIGPLYIKRCLRDERTSQISSYPRILGFCLGSF